MGILTRLELGDSWPHALHDATSLMTQDDRKAILVHPLKEVIEVGVAHTGCDNLLAETNNW